MCKRVRVNGDLGNRRLGCLGFREDVLGGGCVLPSCRFRCPCKGHLPFQKDPENRAASQAEIFPTLQDEASQTSVNKTSPSSQILETNLTRLSNGENRETIVGRSWPHSKGPLCRSFSQLRTQNMGVGDWGVGLEQWSWGAPECKAS